MNADTRALVEQLRADPYNFGPPVICGTGHFALTHPNGEVLVIPNTTSDWRCRQNNLSEAARIAGVRPPKPNAGHYRHVRTPRLDWSKVMDEHSAREVTESVAQSELDSCEARLRSIQIKGRRPDAEAQSLARRIVTLRRVLDPFSTATDGVGWGA